MFEIEEPDRTPRKRAAGGISILALALPGRIDEFPALRANGGFFVFGVLDEDFVAMPLRLSLQHADETPALHRWRRLDAAGLEDRRRNIDELNEG